MTRANAMYCIVPVFNITDKLVNCSDASSIELLRLSIDSNYAIFEFDKTNNLAKEVFYNYLWRDHTAMIAFLNTDVNWATVGF